MAETTYLDAIRQGLAEEMERDERVFLLGEDIGAYGGAFKVTEGFLARFGPYQDPFRIGGRKRRLSRRQRRGDRHR